MYPALRKVLVEFAKHAFEHEIKSNHRLKDKYSVTNKTSSYDQLYQLITKAIEGKPALFSWLSNAEKQEAIISIKNNIPISDIRFINNPFGP